MQQQFTTSEPTGGYVPFAAPAEKSLEMDTAAHQAETLQVMRVLDAARRKVRRRNIRYGVCAASVQIVNISIQAFTHYLPPVSRHTFWMLLLFLLCGVTEIVLGVALIYLMCKPVDFDVEELTRLGGIRAVPALVDALRSSGARRVCRPLHRALTMLLPQMTASDAGLLTASHRRRLNMLLKLGAWPNLGTRPEPDFVVAVLKAYEQVGDVKAIPVVKKLANIRGRSERRRKIRQAAQECLPLLHAHIGDLNTTQTLLRPSGMSTFAPDVLLRPAAETVPAPAEELLRGAQNDTLAD